MLPESGTPGIRSFILVFVIALTVTAASIPWLRRTAIAIGFVDAPDRHKVHKAPVPLMGGIAIVATHDPGRSAEVVDEVVTLQEGRVVPTPRPKPALTAEVAP